MKASLEVKEVEYRGVLLESETPEEKEVLERVWSGHGRVVALERLMNGQVKICIAPTPQLDGEGKAVLKREDIPRLKPGEGEEKRAG